MGFNPSRPFTVVGAGEPKYFPALDPVPPLTEAEIREVKVKAGKATPQEQLDYEHDQLTAEKGFLRAGLGIGEEGKGILRQALGSTITLGGKALGNINPQAYLLRRRGRNIGDQYIEEAGRAVSELGTENIREAREIGQDLGGGETGEMIQDLGATFTASAPAIPAAILGGLPAAALTAGATQYGASREQYKQQFMAQGLPEQEAERRAEIPAALGGVITATLTRAIPGGSEMLLNRILSGEVTAQGAAKFVSGLVMRELPSEMTEEGADQIGQGFVERLMVNPNKSFHEIAEDTVNAMTAAGILTGVLGGGGAVVAGTAQAIARPFERRARPIDQPTRRPYATQERQEQVSVQPQRVEVTPGRPEPVPVTSDIVQPGTPPEAQAPIDTSNFIVSVQATSGEVPGNIQIIDRTQTETSQSPTVESLRAAGLAVPDFGILPQGQYTYDQARQKFTDTINAANRVRDFLHVGQADAIRILTAPDSENEIRTVMDERGAPIVGLQAESPEHRAALGEGIAQALAFVNKEKKLLQGDLRSPQQVPVREGAGAIPAAPPAIQIIGTPIPEHQPLLDQVMAKIQGENNLSPGLPVRRINLVNSGPAIYTVPSEGGFDTVNVNLPRMQEQAATRGLNVDQYLALAANEEVIHNAGGAASYDRWKALGSATPFPQFYNQEMEAIFNEIAPPQRASLQKVYGGPLDPVGMAEEHVRQLIQAKMRGEITEQSLGEATVRYLKALLQKLQALFTAAVAPDRKTLLGQQLRAVESILTEQQARPPAERFYSEGQVAGAAETDEIKRAINVLGEYFQVQIDRGAVHPVIATRIDSSGETVDIYSGSDSFSEELGKAGNKNSLSQEEALALRAIHDLVSESPFDRMRRESGAEPPPELTPEEQAAKDRNEKRRGMRPNPRIAGAFSPQDKLAAENGDEFWGIPTKVGGTEDRVRDRVRMTPESTVESQRHAQRTFQEAGIEVTWLEHTPATEEQPSKGIWRYVQKKNHEGGRKLVALLERELRTGNDLLLASLINSVRYNNKLGNDQAVFDAPTRMALYIAAQAEASHRGLALGELSQHPATLPDIARNVDVVLNRIYHDAFGGEVIDEAMDKLRRGIQTFFSKPFIQQILASNPQLNESIEMINALGLGNQVPDAAQLIHEVFQTPFYKMSDLAEMFRDKLVKDYGMDEAEARKASKRFQEAFDKHLKQAADEALKIATANLTYKKKVAVKSRKTVDRLLKDAIEKGQLDSGEVLRQIAKENWGSTPSDADIAEMKRLAQKHDALGTLTPVEEAEVRKLDGDTPEALERARQIKEAGNQPVRVAIQKQMEVAWARMKKPIVIPTLNPSTWRPYWQTKGNLAMAVNEFIAANILAKVSFATRQLVAIFSQWISYVPTRAIGDALVNHKHAQVMGQPSALPKEMASALRDGYKQQIGALLPALSAMQSALFGRAESRNVIQLMSDMASLERLTKNAEEHWNKANELMAAGNVVGASAEFSKASLFYFISMTKMGYRVAQGLDRLQGIPVHYQNMSQQVMRALRDAGKTVAEAETSRDFVIGDIKQQWLLAIPIAKNYLEQSGEPFSTQDIKNAAWNIVKRKQYQRIAQLGLKADQFEEENNFLENTVGWNQREVRGLGGAVAVSMRKVEQVAESWGLPLVVTRFANAIGISINQALMYTPAWLQANMGSGPESAWFKSETDRAQQRVKAAVGSALGAVGIGLVMSGYLVVRLKWPRDKEERDLWEREGHRPNTVEWKISDTEFIPFSLNNSPFMFVAPYLAAGGALRDAFDEQTKAQAKLDEEALKSGLPAGKAPGPGPADLFLVAAEAAKQVVLGGRTAAGLIGSVSSYGEPNAKKTTGSYVSALIPFAPAAQDISRMAGVRMDEKMASVWDFIIPLPTSEARKFNMLGDPVSTPDDVQRVLQIMTGGTYPGVVDSGAARQESGYQALFASGFRPPSISPGKGYEINGIFRPMNESELSKYTQLRGQYFKQALSGFGAAATMEEIRAAFQEANQRALRETGVAIAESQQPRSASTTRPSTRPRPRRSRYGVGLRRGRSPRLRSGRRIRALRRVPLVRQRRVRLLAA